MFNFRTLSLGTSVTATLGEIHDIHYVVTFASNGVVSAVCATVYDDSEAMRSTATVYSAKQNQHDVVRW